MRPRHEYSLKQPDDSHVQPSSPAKGTFCLRPSAAPQRMQKRKRPRFDETPGRLQAWWAKSHTSFPSTGTACRRGVLSTLDFYLLCHIKSQVLQQPIWPKAQPWPLPLHQLGSCAPTVQLRMGLSVLWSWRLGRSGGTPRRWTLVRGLSIGGCQWTVADVPFYDIHIAVGWLLERGRPPQQIRASSWFCSSWYKKSRLNLKSSCIIKGFFNLTFVNERKGRAVWFFKYPSSIVITWF